MIIIGIVLSVLFFCLSVLLIMANTRVYRNGILEYLGCGYKNQLVAENSFYAHLDKSKAKAVVLLWMKTIFTF